jgi:hypothetical protein
MFGHRDARIRKRGQEFEVFEAGDIFTKCDEERKKRVSVNPKINAAGESFSSFRK